MTYDVATEMGDFLDRECSGPGCINSVSIKWNLRRQGILDAEFLGCRLSILVLDVAILG